MQRGHSPDLSKISQTSHEDHVWRTEQCWWMNSNLLSFFLLLATFCWRAVAFIQNCLLYGYGERSTALSHPGHYANFIFAPRSCCFIPFFLHWRDLVESLTNPSPPPPPPLSFFLVLRMIWLLLVLTGLNHPKGFAYPAFQQLMSERKRGQSSPQRRGKKEEGEKP